MELCEGSDAAGARGPVRIQGRREPEEPGRLLLASVGDRIGKGANMDLTGDRPQFGEETNEPVFLKGESHVPTKE